MKLTTKEETRNILFGAREQGHKPEGFCKEGICSNASFFGKSLA